MPSAPRVLIFDSGIGGLSIARCIRDALPGVAMVYLADNAAFPYGGQSESTVVSRTAMLVEAALVEYPADLVIIACNTASTIVLPELRGRLSVPVVGVVPAVKPAAAVSENRKIGVLATPATVSREYLNRLIHDFANDCDVVRIGHPELVHWIEAEVAGAGIQKEALREVLQPFADTGVDTVVLGCTHYPLIATLLREALPSVRHWVDSGAAIARRVRWLLEHPGDNVTQDLTVDRDGKVDVMIFSGPEMAGIQAYASRHGLDVQAVVSQWSLDQAGQLEDREQVDSR